MPGTAPPTRACRKWRAPSRGRAGTARASSACGTESLESAHDAPSPEAVAVRDLRAGLDRANSHEDHHGELGCTPALKACSGHARHSWSKIRAVGISREFSRILG